MKKIGLIVFCLLLPLFLLLTAYQTAILITDLNANQQQTIDYLQNQQELSLNYTAIELSHLEDVKAVMTWADYLFYFSLLISTLILTWERKKSWKKLLFYGGIVTISLIAVIGIITIISFDFIFTLFHQIFFSQGNWQFAFDSLLIQTFPEDFFIGMSLKIGLLGLILGLMAIVVSRIKFKH